MILPILIATAVLDDLDDILAELFGVRPLVIVPTFKRFGVSTFLTR